MFIYPNREVSTNDGEELGKKENIPYFEVSAKTNEGLKKMFYSVIAELSVFDDGEDKQTLIKELEKENENESKDDAVDTASNRNQQGELNVQGAKKSENKKSKCNC